MANLFEDAFVGDGERCETLASGAVRIEHIAGAATSPQGYLQDDDEWVVLLRGSAQLDVDGVRHSLVAGDWLDLPAGTPHTLVSSTPDAVWLAVHR